MPNGTTHRKFFHAPKPISILLVLLLEQSKVSFYDYLLLQEFSPFHKIAIFVEIRLEKTVGLSCCVLFNFLIFFFFFIMNHSWFCMFLSSVTWSYNFQIMYFFDNKTQKSSLSVLSLIDFSFQKYFHNNFTVESHSVSWWISSINSKSSKHFFIFKNKWINVSLHRFKWMCSNLPIFLEVS